MPSSGHIIPEDGVTQSFYTDVAAELCSDAEGLGGPKSTWMTWVKHSRRLEQPEVDQDGI